MTSSDRIATPLSTWQKMILLGIAALVVSFVYHAVFLRTPSHWWFEDDPDQFAFVKQISNPVRFFTEIEVIKGFGGHGAIAPMQAVSEWIDSQVDYRSARFATVHNMVSLAATLLLLFLVLRQFRFNAASALVLCGLWLCLPATIAINEFLATRHYLEGFAASLLAIIIAQALAAGTWRENWKSVAILSIAVAHAALYKEVFATALPVFLAVYLYTHGRKYAAAASGLVLGLFFAYRYWVFGDSLAWGIPFLGPLEYLRFVGRLPYILAGNAGGYLLLGVAAASLAAGYRKKKIDPVTIGLGFLLIVVELAVIYPVSWAVDHDWLRCGTWDRAVFLLNTTLLLAGGYLVAKTFSMRMRVIAAALAFLVLIPGMVRSRQTWHKAMIRYKNEGKFYLGHPDRLLYCELPGPWYLEGLCKLYEIPTRHHIVAAIPNQMPRKDMERYGTIWRYVEGKFRPDAALYADLLKNAPDDAR